MEEAASDECRWLYRWLYTDGYTDGYTQMAIYPRVVATKRSAQPERCSLLQQEISHALLKFIYTSYNNELNNTNSSDKYNYEPLFCSRYLDCFYFVRYRNYKMGKMSFEKNEPDQLQKLLKSQ